MKRIDNEGIITIKRNIIFLGVFLALFLVIGSSYAIAITESSDNKTLTLHPGVSINKHIGGSGLGDSSNVIENFPSSYDLRSLNKVTPVNDQGNAGNCWAFATCGSLESTLLPGENWNFSENHMKNLLSSAAPEGFDLDINSGEGNDSGGTMLKATAYLVRWSGPVSADDDPYSASSVYSSSELRLPVQKHVQDVYFLSARTGPLDNNEIKSAIMKHGAVATSIYCTTPTFYFINETAIATVWEDYNNVTHGYYYNESLDSNHGVDIIGWDDNFDKNKFSSVPPGNGAFIVKNSWGKKFGENGYFYVSYYDSNIGKDNAVFTAENTNNFQNVYQYDTFGLTGNTGYSSSTAAWCANVFTAKSDEVLKAVSFYAINSTCNYDLYIYTDPNSGPINQSGPVHTQSGEIPAGYHTVHLSSDSGIPLKANQRFSVVLKLTTPQSTNPISLESPVPGYSSKATANIGESFVSSDGSQWNDITNIQNYSNTNVCIKAFTDSGNELPVQVNITQSSPVADFTSDVTSGGAPLSVQFTDLSQNETSRIWDFGDGSNSTDKNPEHTYNTVGTYTVILKAINEAGSSTKTVIITVGSGSSSNTNNNTNSNNDTSTSTDSGTNSTNNETNSTNNGVNDNSTTCTEAKTSCTNLIADFSTFIGSGTLKVKFTDKSKGDISSWKWSFGDGTYSTCKNPSHTYCKAGKYTVTLTIKDSEGNKKTKCKCVTVTDSSKKESSKNAKKVCKSTKKISKNTKNTNKNPQKFGSCP